MSRESQYPTNASLTSLETGTACELQTSHPREFGAVEYEHCAPRAGATAFSIASLEVRFTSWRRHSTYSDTRPTPSCQYRPSTVHARSVYGATARSSVSVSNAMVRVPVSTSSLNCRSRSWSPETSAPARESSGAGRLGMPGAYVARQATNATRLTVIRTLVDANECVAMIATSVPHVEPMAKSLVDVVGQIAGRNRPLRGRTAS